MMHIISLGAGVQSTTMALMAAHGEITPMPECAIFSDTGWEPKKVYEHLRWISSPNVLPFPTYIVSTGNLREDLIHQSVNSTGQRFASVPWFIKNKDGSAGLGRRQCTAEYKILPLSRKLRALLGYQPRQRIPVDSVELWMGISTDEIMRMRPAREPWKKHRWPLIEQRMSRSDCLLWLERHGYPVPAKSSCIGCPFHSDAHWRDMKLNSPDEFADAVEVDRAIRKGPRTMHGAQYMHDSLKPLDEVDLRNAGDRGQLDLFNNECEGMCGV